jgi:uncharacterized protein YeeX (DUF496 family)
MRNKWSDIIDNLSNIANKKNSDKIDDFIVSNNYITRERYNLRNGVNDYGALVTERQVGGEYATFGYIGSQTTVGK